MHRNSWVCPRCSGIFESSEALERHIEERHSQEISSKQITTVIEQSRRPIEFIQPNECPFCDDEWASVELSAIPEEEVLVVDLDEFRRHLGHHLQQAALFSLPRLNQDQEMDSNHVVGFLDRDAMPAGYRWVRDDCGRGWSIVSDRRATFVALAFFLAKCRMGSSTHVDDKDGGMDIRAPRFLPFRRLTNRLGRTDDLKVKVRVNLELGNYVVLIVVFDTPYQSLVDRINAKLARFTTDYIGEGLLKLKYRDEDGDVVSIEGDEDLKIAFSEVVYSHGLGEIELFCVGNIS